MNRYFVGIPILGLLLSLGLFCDDTTAAEGDSAAAPLMRLLKSGRLPKERLDNVIDIICQRGNADDLAYIFAQCLSTDGYTGELRRRTLGSLAQATRTRKVVPKGDLSGLGMILLSNDATHDPRTQLVSIQLAGLWKVESLVGVLQKVALNNQSAFNLRTAAIDGIARIGGKTATDTILKLTSSQQSQKIRFLAVAALASLDLDKAAAIAPDILRDSNDADDPAPMMAAFLERRGGPEALSTALEGKELPIDAAKLALRYMYSVGRSDAVLSNALSTSAGITTEVKPLNKKEIDQLAVEVLEKGQAARGEAIFRRADLSCIKCHSLSKAGGIVGPDLSALGSSSPIDYVIRSIFFPNQAVKEQYKTIVVVTAEGKVYTGILVDKNADRLILKLADGKQKIIPTDDIDDQGEGQSLMPKGLTRFLTHAELLDLIRFISELGKPGPYTIRTTPTIQRWRVLKPVPTDLAAAVPDQVNFQLKVLEADATRWLPTYARVGGQLPLDELAKNVGSDVLYLYGETNVTAEGKIGVRVNSSAGVRVWVDDQPLPQKSETVTNMKRGRHKIILRVDTTQQSTTELKAELFRVKGSTAEFTVVDGP